MGFQRPRPGLHHVVIVDRQNCGAADAARLYRVGIFDKLRRMRVMTCRGKSARQPNQNHLADGEKLLDRNIFNRTVVRLHPEGAVRQAFSDFNHGCVIW